MKFISDGVNYFKVDLEGSKYSAKDFAYAIFKEYRNEFKKNVDRVDLQIVFCNNGTPKYITDMSSDQVEHLEGDGYARLDNVFIPCHDIDESDIQGVVALAFCDTLNNQVKAYLY